MRFETVPVAEADGAILAHGVRAGGRLFKKGRALIPADLALLAASGVKTLTVARIDADECPEDLAATRIAEALTGNWLTRGAAFTGRVNLYADDHGLALVNDAAIDAINLIDESVTVATLKPFAVVAKGDMVATVKIIPFAAPERAVIAAAAEAARAPIRVAPFTAKHAALISTQLPGQKPALLDKNRIALDTRLKKLGGAVISEARVAHDAAALTAALKTAPGDADIVFVFGASAITDRRDVIPAGIVAAGGQVVHFGMPVDPGNLLLLGDLNGRPVVGLPSCARSPKLNGFDFVLQRLCADVPIARRDIMKMGVGGLLQEISSRPQARETELSILRAPRIGAVVMAAGLSSRMGANKLLAEWRGKPLIRFAAEAAVRSQAKPVIVVTGHEKEKIEAALKGLDVIFAHNPRYAEGMSTSLKAGLAALPEDADGAVVLLGDMPEITASLINRMIAAFSPADGRSICVAVHQHERGNPVLWARRFFEEIEAVSGDVGAKPVLAAHEDMVCEIEAGQASLADIDTKAALAELNTRSAKERLVI